MTLGAAPANGPEIMKARRDAHARTRRRAQREEALRAIAEDIRRRLAAIAAIMGPARHVEEAQSLHLAHFPPRTGIRWLVDATGKPGPAGLRRPVARPVELSLPAREAAALVLFDALGGADLVAQLRSPDRQSLALGVRLSAPCPPASAHQRLAAARALAGARPEAEQAVMAALAAAGA